MASHCAPPSNHQSGEQSENESNKPLLSEGQKNYLDQYMKHEGISLDPEKIERNEARRCVAKLCLNSLWGRFGMRDNLPRQTTVSTQEDFCNYISNPMYKVSNFHVLAEDILQLEYTNHDQFVPANSSANIFIAVFTTSLARIELYKLLDSLGERVMYYDTDSVIFVTREGDTNPPLGDYLGELTSELDPGDYIVEFVSAGPKNYSYVTHFGKVVSKVRGFTLNFANSKQINFDSIKNLVLSSLDPEQYPVVQEQITNIGDLKARRGERVGRACHPEQLCICTVNPSKIVRDSREFKIRNRVEEKVYKLVYSKLVINHLTKDTLPYGY